MFRILLSTALLVAAPSLADPSDAPPLVGAPSDADRALIAASSAAVEPGPLEVRVLAVEDLGLLGDGRAVPLLRRLLVTEQHPALQRAAVKALRALGSPAAASVLDEALRTARLSLEGARELLSALPWLRWEQSRATLQWAAASAALPELRAAAQAALARFDPPQYQLEESP